MNTGPDSQRNYNILPPASLGDKLLFQVFDNALPIGYARLQKLTSRKLRPPNVIDMFDPDGYTSYELKMIEIRQNYRQQGVGSTLLREVIRFCRDADIKRLTGEIKGDAHSLRPWYRQNGFTVGNDDRIELLPVTSC